MSVKTAEYFRLKFLIIINRLTSPDIASQIPAYLIATGKHVHGIS